METKRTFFLGLGHQKCGTTWLHYYLSNFENFARGGAKEYHIWDRVDIPLFKKMSERANYALKQSPDFYFDYFDGLMKNGKTMSADITPSYSGLRAKRLEEIKSKFGQRGIDVKALILVREPLSRIKSAVRFNLDRKYYSEGIRKGETDFESALLQYYKSQDCALRTNYKNIITQAYKVFDEDKVFIGFYENLFTESEITRLSNFLNVEARLNLTKVQVNKTKSSVFETKSDQIIKDFHANTYDYIFGRFPEVKNLWS